jgi:hypothetical protein
MHASIRRYQFKPGMAPEAARLAQAGFLPIIKSVPGFVAYSIVLESHDVGVTISIYESEAQAEESTRRAADWVKENMAALVSGPPTIMAGEVPVYATA